MDKNELVDVRGDQTIALPAESVQELLAGMKAMAAMVAATNERMANLEREVRRLTKITPAQYKEINEAIRTRAAEVCRMHRAQGCETATAAAIRKAMRTTCGVNGAREISRCDYPVALRQVQLWDDFKVMQGIKARGKHETKVD